jgi:transposase
MADLEARLASQAHEIARLRALEPLVASQAHEIARLQAQLAAKDAELAVKDAELAAARARPASGKNPNNSSIPPSQAVPPNRTPGQTKGKQSARSGHPGHGRSRQEPTFTLECHPTRCQGCGADLTHVPGHVRNRSQQVDLPPVAPVVLEVLCYRCVCPNCGTPTTAAYPDGWDPTRRFGPRLEATVAYLHHHHHVGYERLEALLGELFALPISQGGLGNLLSRTQATLTPHYAAIGERVRQSLVVGSDETRARVGGQTRWEWVVQSREAVYHWIAHHRSRQELDDFYGESPPEVQESDCYSAQLASSVATKQVCHAHQLRDLRYAQEHGDEEYAPRMSRLIRRAIHLAHRREKLRPELFAHQAARLKRLGHRLGFGPLTKNPFGEQQQQRYRRLEESWWVFLDRGDVNPTNNASERALRPAVVHRKVTGGFRSEWGAEAYAAFLSVVQTLQREGGEVFGKLLTLLDPHHLRLLGATSDA